MTDAPDDRTNLQEVIPRNLRARQTLANVCKAHPNLADIEREVDAALLDAATLIGEIVEIRSDIATLAAAAKAALKAHDDGIPDPFWFLRDELDAQGWTKGRRA